MSSQSIVPAKESRFQSIVNKYARAILIALLFMLLFQPIHLCWADDQAEIRKILLQCPAVNPSDCVSEDQMDIRIVKIVGDYAHATGRHSDGSSEIDNAYLKKENGHWVLLGEGTGVDPSELGVPKEVW